MAKIANLSYKGNFAKYIEMYLAQKRSLGYILNAAAYTLRHFDLFCRENFPNETTLNKDIAMCWASHADNMAPSTAMYKIQVLRNLAKFILCLGLEAYIIPIEMYSKRSPRYMPYIYTKEELSKIFTTIDTVEKVHYMHHYLYPVVFRLIYCCGLRPYEAVKIKQDEVCWDSGCVKIMDSKLTSRIVMLSDDMLKLLKEYKELFSKRLAKAEYLFPLKKTHYSSRGLTKKFAEITKLAGVTGTINKPRLYDLRHTFATHKIYEWTRLGKDLNTCIPYLSEYMGHKSTSLTLYYVHLAPEIFPDIKALSPKWYPIAEVEDEIV